MIRGNLGMAMQGLAVVPLFGGYDLDRARRPDLLLRRHRRPLRGARPPRGRLRLGVRARLAEEAVAARARRRRRGPGRGRGARRRGGRRLRHRRPGPHARRIWPVVATVTEAGYLRVSDADLGRGRGAGRAGAPAQRTRAPRGWRCAMSMPFYVSPEQLMKDRADYARKGIARGRSVVVLQYDDGIAFATENPSRALHKISEIYDRIALRGRRQVQRVREPAGRRRAVRRPARLLLRPRGRHRARAWPTPTRRRSARRSPPSPSRSRSRSSSPRSGRAAADDQIYRLAYDGSVDRRARLRRHGRPGRAARRGCRRASGGPG